MGLLGMRDEKYQDLHAVWVGRGVSVVQCRPTQLMISIEKFVFTGH